MKKHWLLSTLLLGWVFIVYEYALRVSDSVIVDKLMHSLAIGPGQIGILSSAYYLPYIIMQIPAGLLIDRLGIRRCWPLALGCIALGCYMFSHSNGTLMASLGRAFMGFGSAFAWVGAIKVIYRLSNGRHDALYIGISMTLCMLGAVIGQAPWLYLTTVFGNWQTPYQVAAIAGIILSLLTYIFAHDYKHDNKPMPTLAEIIRSCMPLLRSTNFWLLILYMTAISTPQNVFSALWANEFLKRDFHLAGQTAATVLSMIWFGGLLGAPLIGWISDQIENQKVFLIVAGLLTLSLMALMIYWQPQSIIVIGALLFLIGLVTNTSVIVYALASKMAPHTATSSIIGVANMVNMSGAALAQLTLSWILNATVTEHNIGNFKIALTLIPALVLITTFNLLFLKLQRN